jgi:hypothetical protein
VSKHNLPEVADFVSCRQLQSGVPQGFFAIDKSAQALLYSLLE